MCWPRVSRTDIGSITGFWAGEPMADLLLGLPSLAIHDQTFNGNVTGRRWKLFRPFVRGRLAGHQESDFEPGLGLGAGDARYGSGQSPGGFRSCDRAIPDRGQERQFERRHPDGLDGVSSRASALAGSRSAARTPWFAAAMRSSTIRPGTRAGRDFGRIRLITPNPTRLRLAARVPSPPRPAPPSTDKRLRRSALPTGFPIFTAPPNPLDFTGTLLSQNTELQAGQSAAVQRQRGTPAAGPDCADHRLRGVAQLPYSVDGNNINVGSPSACGTVKGYTLGCGPGGASFGVPYTAFPFSTISKPV